MNKTDLTFTDMLKMQDEQYEKHTWWNQRTPENAKDKLLWMFEELGEVVSIIKKRGKEEIMNASETRTHFIEECVDVLMYFNDVIKSYDISPQDIAEAYIRKYEKNLNRDFTKHSNEHKNSEREKREKDLG